MQNSEAIKDASCGLASGNGGWKAAEVRIDMGWLAGEKAKGYIRMNLKQLEAFVEVAQSGSFSKAARRLYLTQPTVSAHVLSLEKELDVRLFVRNTKEVGLTEEGQRLFFHAKQMVDLEKKIEEEFGQWRGEEKQCVAIAASTVPAQYLLPPLLARFNMKYPGEQLKITEMDSSQVVEQIAERRADIGFTGTVLEKKHCKYLPFYRDEMVIITPNTEKYRSIKNTSKDISWIRKEHMILREEGSGTRKEAEKQFRSLGIMPEELNVVASIGNQETIKKSVIQGLGISVISSLAVREETESGKILAFPIPSERAGRDINVVYNRNCQLSRSAKRFLKTVKEVYRVKGEK